MNDAPLGRAVVLLSGGLDSTTCLAIAAEAGYELYGITFAYGQRHASEVQAARAIGEHYRLAGHVVIEFDLRQFGGSALTSEIEVPKHTNVEAIGAEIPVTYVPARNTVFLSFALGYAETMGTGQIFLGVNALDYSGYPDCRPEYIEAFQRMANLATKAAVTGAQPVTIHAPLLHLTKGEIIARGLALGVDYSLTRSCYDPAPDGAACGACDSCLLRLRGFAENGVKDPAPYVSS